MLNGTRALLLISAALCGNAIAAETQQPPDILTFGCLDNYVGGPDPTVEVCKQLYPDLETQLEDAKRRYEARNAASIRELKAACEGRLERAYAGDRKKIEQARLYARDIQEQENQVMLADKNVWNKVDCHAYVEQFSKGNSRIDDLETIINAVKDVPARPFELQVQ